MNNTIQSFKIFISFFLLFLCTSCDTKNGKDIPFNQFKDVYQVYGKKLNVDTYKFSTYGKMLLFEKEEYIIRENFKSESLIDKIYYTKDSLVSLVKFGQGPNENLSSRIMQKHSDTCFSIFDGKRKTIFFKDISGNTLFESKFSELFFLLYKPMMVIWLQGFLINRISTDIYYTIKKGIKFNHLDTIHKKRR